MKFNTILVAVDFSENSDAAAAAAHELAKQYGATLHVEGYVGTLAQHIAGTHRIELFKADDAPADQNGEIEAGDGLSRAHGEGRWPIGSCTTLPDGSFACDVTIADSLTLGTDDAVTATATDALGNTSEYGPNLAVTVP